MSSFGRFSLSSALIGASNVGCECSVAEIDVDVVSKVIDMAVAAPSPDCLTSTSVPGKAHLWFRLVMGSAGGSGVVYRLYRSGIWPDGQGRIALSTPLRAEHGDGGQVLRGSHRRQAGNPGIRRHRDGCSGDPGGSQSGLEPRRTDRPISRAQSQVKREPPGSIIG